METYKKCLHSPIGWLQLESSLNALIKVSFIEFDEGTDTEQPAILKAATRQLSEYFSGKRTSFSLELNPAGTIFQRKVWDFVGDVEFGKTSSYLQIAKNTGSVNNTRAVGMANGKNPIPIIIPCHRIIGSNGKLTGYAGGLHKKRWLLQHEQRYMHNKTTLF